MLIDWIAREGWIVFNWWLLVTAAGLTALPLCVRLLGGLPDRGYTLARAVGLLLLGFVYWLMGSLGLLQNSNGSIVLCWLILLIAALSIYYRIGAPFNWREWWQENRRLIFTAEVLFAVLLVGWSIYRAYQNSLTSTEKPMELAFMSAVQRSEFFPPNDPWMAGYAISYYYFGYIISGMLIMLSGVQSTVGFNMVVALLFALTGLTAFGVVYNLVRSRAFRMGGGLHEKAPPQTIALAVGLLGMVFVVLLGNFQFIIIEGPYNARSVSESYLRFWGTQARQSYPAIIGEGTGDPTRWDWFRPSRVLTDYQLNGDLQPDWYAQPIDEFPQFSFILGDNHPHVLALPFAVMALGLGLNVLLTGRGPTRAESIFYGICIGGLIFLNTWDGPIYLALLVGVDGLRRMMRSGSGRLRLNDYLEMLLLAAGLALVTLICYLPFFISFRSQASGILPNLVTPTLFRQFFIMFGPFLLILAPFFIVEAWRGQRAQRMNWALGFKLAGALIGLLVLLMIALIVVASVVLAQQSAQAAAAGQPPPPIVDSVLRFVEDNGGWGSVLPGLIRRRLEYIVTTLVLLAGIALAAGRLFPRLGVVKRDATMPEEDTRQVITYPPATGFALLVAGAGLVLTLVPEFVYLRDNFGTRINTIFKFYYQAWVMFSIASAYAVYTILADHRLMLPGRATRWGFAILLTVVTAAGLVYPVVAMYTRMFAETGRLAAEISLPPTLDGGPTMIDPNDYAVIMCLDQHVPGSDVVVAEAIGNPYNPRIGRVGSLTGIPIVLGWENHERQWRGPTYGEIAGTRAPDMADLYTELRWDVAQNILAKYGIDYIMYGESERLQYGTSGEEKFRENLEVICEAGSSRIYRVSQQDITLQR